MNTGVIIVAGVGAVALTGIGWGIGVYNTLSIGRQDIKTQWSNVLTEYQRRADLILNLAASVKSYAKFEKGTFTDVAKARSAISNPDVDKTKAMQAMKGIDGVLSKLMVVMEQYPKLRAVEQYQELTSELKMTENRINIARTDYNDVVRSYNIMVVTVPSKWIASRFGFKEETFFEGEKGNDKAPDISKALEV